MVTLIFLLFVSKSSGVVQTADKCAKKKKKLKSPNSRPSCPWRVLVVRLSPSQWPRSGRVRSPKENPSETFSTALEKRPGRWPEHGASVGLQLPWDIWAGDHSCGHEGKEHLQLWERRWWNEKWWRRCISLMQRDRKWALYLQRDSVLQIQGK